jgi:Histidine kinase-, DNA gyrase B-, and HSP90-like ATPase
MTAHPAPGFRKPRAGGGGSVGERASVNFPHRWRARALGLTLYRKFVELHGGRIWVTSQMGVGSTFTFTIPVRHGE